MGAPEQNCLGASAAASSGNRLLQGCQSESIDIRALWGCEVCLRYRSMVHPREDHRPQSSLKFRPAPAKTAAKMKEPAVLAVAYDFCDESTC
eukprot:798754-Prymnesium_polylepis.1